MGKQDLNLSLEKAIQHHQLRQQLLTLIPDDDTYAEHTVVLVSAIPRANDSYERTYALFKVSVSDDGRPYPIPRWYITGPTIGRPVAIGAVITDYLVWDDLPGWLTDRVHITKWEVLINPGSSSQIGSVSD